jgi:hypothetical protein
MASLSSRCVSPDAVGADEPGSGSDSLAAEDLSFSQTCTKQSDPGAIQSSCNIRRSSLDHAHYQQYRPASHSQCARAFRAPDICLSQYATNSAGPRETGERGPIHPACRSPRTGKPPHPAPAGYSSCRTCCSRPRSGSPRHPLAAPIRRLMSPVNVSSALLRDAG